MGKCQGSTGQPSTPNASGPRYVVTSNTFTGKWYLNKRINWLLDEGVRVSKHIARGRKIRKDLRLELDLFDVFSKLKKLVQSPFEQKTHDYVRELRNGPLKSLAFSMNHPVNIQRTLASVGLNVRTWVVDIILGVLSRDGI